jgi:hypothetical protein
MSKNQDNHSCLILLILILAIIIALAGLAVATDSQRAADGAGVVLGISPLLLALQAERSERG